MIGRILKVRKGKWGLLTLLCDELAPFWYDDIFIEGDFWFFEKDGLMAITSGEEILDSYGKGLDLEFKFEDYELVDDQTLIGFRDDRECLLKSDRSFLVPWGIHHIFPDPHAGYVKEYKIGRAHV